MHHDSRLIMPILCFAERAEEAAAFYVSLFPDSKILATVHRTQDSADGVPAGRLLSVTFTLRGYEYMAVNGGDAFKFSDAMSMYVRCETQDEIDTYWEGLTAGGQVHAGGRLTDRFGLSWQIAPAFLWDVMKSGDHERVNRVNEVLNGMTKPEIAPLKRAWDGAEAPPLVMLDPV